MNYDWMRQKLEAFLALCEQYEAASGPAGEYNRATMKPISDKIDYEVPTVQEIIGQLDQSLLPEGFGTAWHMRGLSETTKATRRALAVVRDREEWKVNLAPDSPSLVADELHPNIWGAAAKIWEAGEYKHAAQAACTSLSDHIKKKAGSHLNDRDLVAQVFKAEPPTASQSGCTCQATRQTKLGNPASKGCTLSRKGHLQASAISPPMTRPPGRNTRRWSILPFSLWSHDGQTRLNWRPRDLQEPGQSFDPSLITFVSKLKATPARRGEDLIAASQAPTMARNDQNIGTQGKARS